MQMQDLFSGFYFNHSQTILKIKGVFVGHIHLDKNIFSILFHKGVICNSLLIILFDDDCVHINVNNFNLTSTQQWVGAFNLFNTICNHTQVTWGGW
jgi:hypothetical protein